ncbi:MAG: phosphate-starvation-inducible protein PsiE [Rhodospirillales bacterium]|jgi:phosphate starvation-inducible membrane PsiE|tara:strand:+ start:280 stop:756 length:477 start_codon:yes stop_codon:yes gene_type:complete
MKKFKLRVLEFNSKIEGAADSLGNSLVNIFHLLALFAIGGAVVWSAIFAFLEMVTVGTASVEDILLLFIYLELGAMVGIYFKTNHMPVRFLIYVAITALTRMLIEIVSDVNSPHGEILSVVGSIVLLTLAVLVLRFGSHKFGQVNDEDASDDNDQQQK